MLSKHPFAESQIQKDPHLYDSSSTLRSRNTGQGWVQESSGLVVPRSVHFDTSTPIKDKTILNEVENWDFRRRVEEKRREVGVRSNVSTGKAVCGADE